MAAKVLTGGLLTLLVESGVITVCNKEEHVNISVRKFGYLLRSGVLKDMGCITSEMSDLGVDY